MYIAIEGIKGVGKSSIINKLVRYFESQKEDFLFARYTMPTNSTIDKIVVRYPILMRNCDWFKEYVYACRSNNLARNIDWSRKIILGDRCIVTSYITRFWRYEKQFEVQIKKVDSLMPLIPAPDIILYLDADLNTIMKRIAIRKRTYGIEDETEEKLNADKLAYEFLKTHCVSKRLSNTKWITIDANQDSETVFQACLLEIYNFLPENKS